MVHAASEELGTAAVTEGVVDGGVDLSRQEREEETEEDAPELVDAPPRLGEEPVEVRVMAGPETERPGGHKSAGDSVPPLAEQPAHDEGGERLHRRRRETRSEAKEKGLDRRG